MVLQMEGNSQWLFSFRIFGTQPCVCLPPLIPSPPLPFFSFGQPFCPQPPTIWSKFDSRYKGTDKPGRMKYSSCPMHVAAAAPSLFHSWVLTFVSVFLPLMYLYGVMHTATAGGAIGVGTPLASATSHCEPNLLMMVMILVKRNIFFPPDPCFYTPFLFIHSLICWLVLNKALPLTVSLFLSLHSSHSCLFCIT